MTLKELSRLIGSPCMVTDGDLEYQATIEDAKEAYGNVRVLIRPDSGTGETWRNLDRVRLLEDGRC